MKPPKNPELQELIRYCSENAMALFPKRNRGTLRQDFAWTIEDQNAVFHMDVRILKEFYWKLVTIAIANIDMLIPDVDNLWSSRMIFKISLEWATSNKASIKLYLIPWENFRSLTIYIFGLNTLNNLSFQFNRFFWEGV